MRGCCMEQSHHAPPSMLASSLSCSGSGDRPVLIVCFDSMAVLESSGFVFAESCSWNHVRGIKYAKKTLGCCKVTDGGPERQARSSGMPRQNHRHLRGRGVA